MIINESDTRVNDNKYNDHEENKSVRYTPMNIIMQNMDDRKYNEWYNNKYIDIPIADLGKLNWCAVIPLGVVNYVRHTRITRRYILGLCCPLIN